MNNILYKVTIKSNEPNVLYSLMLYADSSWHAIELAFTKKHIVQPDRRKYTAATIVKKKRRRVAART